MREKGFIRKRFENVDAAVAQKRLAHAQPLWLGERVASRPRKRNAFAPAASAASRISAAQSRSSAAGGSPTRYHSSMVNSGACSAPRSRLRNTRASAKIFSLARRQQLLHRKFGRRVQVGRRGARRRRRSFPLQSRAGASHCPAKPAARPARPRQTLQPANQARVAASARARARRRGRRSRWRSGVQKGDASTSGGIDNCLPIWFVAARIGSGRGP